MGLLLRFCLTAIALGVICVPPPVSAADPRFLDSHLLVTWYGNPHSARMGVLGQATGAERARALQQQAAAYAALTARAVTPAYHLVAVIAQPSGDYCRRRESESVVRALLTEARAYGFKLVLDIQPGHASVRGEVDSLRPFLNEPDVYLALDPEFAMQPGQTPGRQIGSMRAADVNAAIEVLEAAIAEHQLPPKVLIVHQFTLAMLPDKQNVRASALVDVVLNMDGFGSQSLKLSSYRAVMRQRQLPFAGIKLFYRQDTNLFAPQQILALQPPPAVVIYQ